MFLKSTKSRQETQNVPEITGTILLVDANPLDLETYADVLRHFGHDVRTCSSYEEARHILHNHCFDLVIIGQSNPDFTARGVLEHLHAHGDRPPSLILSKHTDAGTYLQAISLGAANCLRKPVPPQRLKHAVDACLSPQTSEIGY